MRGCFLLILHTILILQKNNTDKMEKALNDFVLEGEESLQQGVMPQSKAPHSGLVWNGRRQSPKPQKKVGMMRIVLFGAILMVAGLPAAWGSVVSNATCGVNAGTAKTDICVI